jgi:Xaa-Pro dipeptidase
VRVSVIKTRFGIAEPSLDDQRATEVERKLAAVRGLLSGRELPAVALRCTDAVAWVTGGLTNRIEAGNPASAAWVVVTPEAAHVVTTNVELPRLTAEGGLDAFELHGVDWYEPGGLARLGEQVAGAPAARIGGLGIDVDEELVELRLSLDPAERARLAALSFDAAAALEGAVRQWVPGELDIEIQARVAAALERTGAFGACLIVGGDDRVERFRHPLAAAEPVQRLLMAVVVAERHGLHAAATRFASARRLPDSVRAARRAAADAERAVLDASRPSATYGDALLALADAYANAGHAGEWRNHYQGGPIGYRQREFEIVPSQVDSRWFTAPISAGTALAWNPSVAGGGKCEDTYLVEEHGLRRLTDTAAWPLEDGRPAVLDVVSGEAA